MAIEPGFYFLPALAAFSTTLVGTYLLIPRLRRSGLVGRDMNKPGQPEVAEMGGIAIFAGMMAGMSAAIGFETFFHMISIDIPRIMAAMATIAIIAAIGILDDLIAIRQITKAAMPAFASLPLIAVRAGDSTMGLPLVGSIDFGILYPLVIIPLIVAGSANAVNMLAGFNGLEAGLGAVIFGTLAIAGALQGNSDLIAIALPAFAACVAFLIFNWYPARVFPGDVGTYSIGAALAAAVIVGRNEFLGLILIAPFLIDAMMKAANGFPKTFGKWEDGRLVSPQARPWGLGQLVMSMRGGVTEVGLTTGLLLIQLLAAAGALLYLTW